MSFSIYKRITNIQINSSYQNTNTQRRLILTLHSMLCLGTKLYLFDNTFVGAKQTL